MAETSAAVAAPVAQRLDLAMRDGVRLSTHVLRPASGRSPVLLCRTPYSVEPVIDPMDREMSSAGLISAWFHPGGPQALAEEGWAVVQQDTRGRFASAGQDLAFASDVEDGWDTLDWCAAQPWSTGRVVTCGPSALGLIQGLAARSGHPALAAITQAVGACDLRDGWVREGGALRLAQTVLWGAFQGALGGGLPTEAAAACRAIMGALGDEWSALLSESSLRHLWPAFDAWVRDDERYWERCGRSAAATPAATAGIVATGWYDVFSESALATYRWLHGAGLAPQRLVVGPWSHNLMVREVGELDFGEAATRPDLPALFRAWGMAAATGGELQGGASIFLMGAGEWLQMPAWPPASRPLDLYLAGGAAEEGRLALAAGDDAADAFRYDPANPVSSPGGRTMGILDGPRDQRAVEARDDVLFYTTPVLAKPVTVMGRVEALVHFSTSGRSADVTVKLVDVHPDGRAFNVLDSVRRAPFQPGEAAAIAVELGSTAIRFLAGHRIGVEVSSSNFPRLDRNPSTGEPAATATALHPADQVVHRGRLQPSRITLPCTDSPGGGPLFGPA